MIRSTNHWAYVVVNDCGQVCSFKMDYAAAVKTAAFLKGATIRMVRK